MHQILLKIFLKSRYVTLFSSAMSELILENKGMREVYQKRTKKSLMKGHSCEFLPLILLIYGI